MSTKKSDKKGVKKSKGEVIVSDKVGNYEKHPFFVKKKAKAKAFLNKAGIPASIIKKA